MTLYTLNHFDPTRAGGKARNLFALAKAGFNVPPFIVISGHEIFDVSRSVAHQREAIDRLDESRIPVNEIISLLGTAQGYAVRSSAMTEDGDRFSFAGQYDSFLYVPASGLVHAIQNVWRSALSERVMAYRKEKKLHGFEPVSVIVQVMVPAETSGVGFGINPVTGHRGQQLISAVYGLGEGLVSGQLDADHYTTGAHDIHKTIAAKTHYFDRGPDGDTRLLETPAEKINRPALSEKEIVAVQQLVQKCSSFFGKPQDIEFAFDRGQLYLLQSRPVTGLDRLPDTSGKRVVWDNSNIIESYPGVTTPLTFSFISSSYENAYRLLLGYLGAGPQELDRNKAVFAHTLGLINGRVYYNLRSWYQMLAMVPGYSINAGFMEKMMGVKEKFTLDQPPQLSKTQAWWRTIRMLARLYRLYRTLPRQRKNFEQLLDQTIARYKNTDLASKNAQELMDLFLDFERILLNEWKAPLLNDFFAMIAFGRLQKQCEKLVLDKKNPNIHNDLLCGSSDIVSVEPIHRTLDIARYITGNGELHRWFLQNSDEQVWKALCEGQYPEFFEKTNRYIHDFGERCVGELKLETISFVQHPPSFIQVVRSYIVSGLVDRHNTSGREEQLRLAAEATVKQALRFRWIKKRTFMKTLQQARTLVSNRENLRYGRTRAFGIVRQLFHHMGRNFKAEGILNDERDIFYLTREEISAYLSGTAVTQDLKALVALRRQEYEKYRQGETPAERFETFGAVYHGNHFFSRPAEIREGTLKGVGCCPGTVSARVTVVAHPQETGTLDGNILVTTSTDPGWVTLFPSAAGILVERGSLLSHSAIVAREMGIPCIVGISGLLKTLKTGDVVTMDGSTGQVIIY